ncbi:protein of unknown function [Legionella fallonii LLAP-10]|uniref:Uncharacterized protein n=1 Tax=Legionella fallonii LLAP-10 TaxID=1212491 RepID=A0A098G3G0_9GAMM|nr:protein of unknown function [Legionella fallonii LLAP-10]
MLTVFRLKIKAFYFLYQPIKHIATINLTICSTNISSYQFYLFLIYQVINSTTL